MSELERWTRTPFTAGGITHDTYRLATGPGVVVIHEIPGMTPEVIAFAQEVVDRGYTVVMPDLFGVPGEPATAGAMARSMAKVCVAGEFTTMALGKTTPIAGWLRALARDVHTDVGGPGVGALGMCFTGGYALAMMVEPAVVAPVLAQPATPFAVGRKRAADLGLSPEDLAVVKKRAEAGCPVLGLRFEGDPAVGTRFGTLRRELGDAFIALEFPGRQHSTLTAHRQQEGIDRVLDFFDERLLPSEQ